jgi:hypothetical protein
MCLASIEKAAEFIWFNQKKSCSMAVEIITKEDLQTFRLLLLRDIGELLKGKEDTLKKEWLRSSEVRKFLKISPGTLQNLRITGKLNPSKVNGTYFYLSTEVSGLVEPQKVNKKGGIR